MHFGENFNQFSFVYVKIAILIITSDLVSAGSSQLNLGYEPNAGYFEGQTKEEIQRQRPDMVENRIMQTSDPYEFVNHQKFDYSPSSTEEYWRSNAIELEDLDKTAQSITGTKIMKIGSAIVGGSLFFVTVLLGILARSGARIAPIAYPLAVLPIALLAAIPAIPLFIGTFGAFILTDKFGLHRKRNKRSASKFMVKGQIEREQEFEKTIQILSLITDFGVK